MFVQFILYIQMSVFIDIQHLVIYIDGEKNHSSWYESFKIISYLYLTSDIN